MNRKLVVLNIALVGAMAYTGVELRREWLAAKERTAELRSRMVPVAMAPPFQKSPEVAPVMTSGYANIAQKFLLDPSRNPDIYIEPPPPPPPPPVRPPLPLFHAMMNIGNGPEISLSETAEAEHKWLHAGEKIGQFTLVAFNADDIELEWNGERIIKPLAEIAGHGAGPRQAAETARADVAAAAPRAPVQPQPLGPGAEGANGMRACQDNDSYPDGAVVGGVKKEIGRNALLGSSTCIWKPVGK